MDRLLCDILMKLDDLQHQMRMMLYEVAKLEDHLERLSDGAPDSGRVESDSE